MVVVSFSEEIGKVSYGPIFGTKILVLGILMRIFVFITIFVFLMLVFK